MSQLQEQQFTDKGALIPFLKRIFRYAIHYKFWFWGFIVSVILVGITDAAFPVIWMYFLDTVVTPAIENYANTTTEAMTLAASDQQKLWLYFAFFLGTGMLQVLGVFFFIRYAGRLEENVIYKLRQQMFQRLQNLSFSFYDRSATGWLLSRISSDTKRVAELISWGFLEVIWGSTMIIACLGAMFFYNWQLALIVAITIPCLIFISVRIRLLILRYSREARKLNSEITANYTEHINGVQVNKITAQEERVSREFSGLSNKMRLSSYKASYYTAMYLPMVIFIGSVAAALVLLVGGHLAVLPEGITIGVLAAFFSYATMIFIPIVDISVFYANAQRSLSAGERIFALIDEKIEVKDQANVTDFGRIKGDITFEQVDFHYVEDKPIYKNLNLHLKAGESVALVGATGGGKSTIINLVCRFYEPTGGVLKIDGINYLERSIQSLRSQLGVVLQTPHLFSGTVRDNVKYGREDATEKDITAALTIVGATKFIDRLDEEVGEGGKKLSMGEKQLLSFARAILTNPRILIMDEATSSIDTLTEAKIQSGIDHMIKGRTAIIIAHRLSTIKNCDRILVIKKGAIVEDGTHRSLMEKKGYYHQLYTKQSQREQMGKMAAVSS